MILKKLGKYLVKDSEGKKTLGSHDSYQKALKQLQAIEISKKKRKFKVLG